jgi:bacteriocin-like protein
MHKTKTQKRQKSADTLLKTSRKKEIELTEKELNKVSGGVAKPTGRLKSSNITLKSGG